MPADLLWSPQAGEDLLNIYETIGLDNPDAAERIYTTVENKAALLVEHPRMGMRRPEIRPSTRILIEGPYLVLHETHPDTDDDPVDTVEIVRVVDRRRDLTRPF